MKDRLKSGRGNAMLVSDSVYAACRFFQAFTETELKGRCAIVTSYSPAAGDIKGEETGEGPTEKLLKYDVYRKMLADHFGEPEGQGHAQGRAVQKEAKRRFVNEPGQMKLLTGFDATARDLSLHRQENAGSRSLPGDLPRQPVGRRRQGVRLHHRLQGTCSGRWRARSRTTRARRSRGYDREDVEGLLKDRLEQGRGRLEETRGSGQGAVRTRRAAARHGRVSALLCHGGEDGAADRSGQSERKRLTLYRMVAAFLRAYATWQTR